MSQQASEKEITIDGQVVKVNDVAMMLAGSKQTVQLHVAFTSSLGLAADKVVAHQAAAFFSANASTVLFDELISALEIGDGVAVKMLLDLGGVINRAHKGFWSDFQQADEGLAPALPDDLESRRAGIMARLADARSRYDALKVRVAALDVHASKVAASVVCNALVRVETGAVESAQAAFGKMELTVSDEQLQRVVQGAMADLQFAGKSEEEALVIIAEKLGATPEAQKQALVQSQIESLGLGRQGVQDGALLSAEAEIATLEKGVELVNGLLG